VLLLLLLLLPFLQHWTHFGVCCSMKMFASAKVNHCVLWHAKESR
jgi:hypothetical protein